MEVERSSNCGKSVFEAKRIPFRVIKMPRKINGSQVAVPDYWIGIKVGVIYEGNHSRYRNDRFRSRRR
jgi:hypothetical protein